MSGLLKTLLPPIFRFVDLDTVFGLIGQLRLIGPVVWLGVVIAVVQQDLPWKNTLLVVSAILPFVILLLSQLNFVRSVFWSANVSHRWLQPWFMEALDYIMKNSEEGNPSSIVKAMDHFCWTRGPMMNVGDVKGAIIDKVLLSVRPKVALELGTHMGYSAVRFGALVSPDSQYHAVDPDPMGQAMTAKLLAHAGLTNRVRLW